MTLLDDLRTRAEADDLSGVVAVSRAGERLVEYSHGFADRANERPIDLQTRFGLASVAKGFTALVAASLIESGELRLDTTVRSLFPDALQLIDPGVTIEHLLSHTSGIGDYLDESELDDIDAYVMTLPVHVLDRPEAYLPMLEGHPQRTPPGERFAYNNGGFVVLAIAIERASGRDYYDLIQERVLDPAGMADTGFERSDRLPAGAALGYLQDGRTNVLHLPVRGVGDGGIYSTVADLEAFWAALFGGRILPMPVVEGLVAPRHDVPSEGRRYGLGFWLLGERDGVHLEGMDAGVSCRTGFDRGSGTIYTVISNTSSGAWPLIDVVEGHLPDPADGGVADEPEPTRA